MRARVVRVTGLVLAVVMVVVAGLGVAWGMSEPEDAGFIAGVTVALGMLLGLVVCGVGAIVWAILRGNRA